MKIQKILTVLLLVGLVSLPVFVSAASSTINSKITTAIENAISAAGTILVSVCALFIIYAAFLMLTAAGDANKVGTAKTIIIWAAAGLAIGLLAMPIAKTVESIIG